uniref:Transmembrane protein n=1 Tax=Steinernema glaseri TaxID=37863 RepID=A0A1I8AEF6_9BILA
MSSGAVSHSSSSSTLPCDLFRALRPQLNKGRSLVVFSTNTTPLLGYFTVLTSLLQFLLAVCFLITGLLEAFFYERGISGLILALFGLLLGILCIQHFFGWYYNSAVLLLGHSAACALIGTLVFCSSIGILLCEIYNAPFLAHSNFRTHIHVFLIEALLSLPLMFMFGVTTWSRAVEINRFVDMASLFILTTERIDRFAQSALGDTACDSPPRPVNLPEAWAQEVESGYLSNEK